MTRIASPPPVITIALTRHAEDDQLLEGALLCLAGQRNITATVLVLDQRPAAAIEQFCRDRADGAVSFHYHREPSCGISRARNRALALCRTDLLLFTEPDARPEVGWARTLADTLAAGAAIAGGRILPDWQDRPPLVARSGLIMDLYSLLDLGPGRHAADKVIGCNFGINLPLLGRELACFDEGYGRMPGNLMGGEETELCRRAREQGLQIQYDGQAIVWHHIARERTRYRWLLRRIYAAGMSRAMQGGVPAPANPSAVHWATLLALPLYAAYLLGFCRWRCRGSGQARAGVNRG
ncbi:MAG: hypothetical protein RJQ10_02495 [Haliea sp.]|uniref:glycosyltransferase family 2 protein n=1 Tax=Haliea sp. TaxID=1932666 RepID=UPI0032F09664